MTWFIYAIVAIFTASFINILRRILIKDGDPISYSIITQLSGALLALSFAIWKGFEMPPIKEYPLNFALVGILYAINTLFSFKALKLIEASQAVIIFSFGTVVAIISSAVFLKEILTIQRLIGTLFIIISIFLVTKLKNFSVNRGNLYALAAAVCGGLATVNDTYLLRFSEAVSYTAIGFLLPGILLLFFYPRSVKKFNSFLKPKTASNIFLLALTWVVSAIAFYTAIEKGALASQISPIMQSGIILTILLAVIFLKERDNLPTKIAAGLMTIMGVIMIK
ncbi:DMT family transporter [Candidatus Parcubacteria bacterium]|nr:DMT family transporter [Patescibacteria group bacterium]MBU4466499.1 DMT family transporter [Patescibacteria group bacterium]MCG2688743.1 DMT family transporter [Candidatus Parcubacteria bacterium]